MNAAPMPAASALFGNREQLDVSRALSELRARRPVRVNASHESLIVLPVEGLDDRRLREFAGLSADTSQLIVTRQRACALGIDTSTPMALPISDNVDAAAILELAAGGRSRFTVRAEPASQAASAAIRLVKLVHGLPAVLASSAAAIDGDMLRSIVVVDADAIHRFLTETAKPLTVASEAVVPLASGSAARFVVLRDTLGDNQVAIVVGKPDPSEAVPVRLHSACLTGDVFGSRRCDCGDQLQLALARIESLGGGVILYLAQEGRGIGLANKMRAYTLQDGGLDTRDANTTLGFEDDERDYGVAALMLRTLGYPKIVLLTNNPAKLDGLTKAGIEIAARLPIEAPITAHNRRYMTAKAVRSGHKLVTLKAPAGET
jgi:GTP cyclohydrolase II